MRGDGIVERRLFDVKRAAAYLSMSERLFEEQVDCGEIPVKRIPGVRRNFYDRRDLDLFADSLPRVNEPVLELVHGKRVSSRKNLVD